MIYSNSCEIYSTSSPPPPPKHYPKWTLLKLPWQRFADDTQSVLGIKEFLFERPRYATHKTTLTVRVIAILQRKNLNHLYGTNLSITLINRKSLAVNNKIYKRHPTFLGLRTLPPFITIVFDFCYVYFFHIIIIVYDINSCLL